MQFLNHLYCWILKLYCYISFIMWNLYMLLKYLCNPICTLVWNGQKYMWYGIWLYYIFISYLISNRWKRHEFTRSLTVWWYKYLEIYLIFNFFLQFLLHSKRVFSIWNRVSIISSHSISNLVIYSSTTLLFIYNKFEYRYPLVGTRKQFDLFTLTGATAMSNEGNTVLPPNSTSLSWKRGIVLKYDHLTILLVTSVKSSWISA